MQPSPTKIISPVKSAESSRKTDFLLRYESCPAVDGAAYMPGVGYIWSECMMNTDELLNVRV